MWVALHFLRHVSFGLLLLLRVCYNEGVENKDVTASEIGKFVYCNRGWWLWPHGLPETKQMAAGTVAHENLATSLHTNTRNIQLAWIIIACGIVLLLVALLVLVN